VHLFGKNVNAYRPAELQELRAKRIGFIFQTFYLIDSLTVLENAMLVMRFAGLSRRESRNRAMSYLKKFGVERYAGTCPRHLSQGEKQRVALARALSADAKLIIGDEPTGSLASGQGMEIVSLISESVKAGNRCAVVASHDERISAFADRIIRLEDGRLR
jgi:ABC-type lipoprotein export system ATPase subunit